MVTVTGRGGIGKTATVCLLLKGLEAGRIPDVEGDLAAVKAGGIVYLSSNGAHQVDYPTLVADLLRLLPQQDARRLQRLYQDPHQSPAQVMLAVLEAFPAGDPVVVLLDNLESVMDAERETLTDPVLHQALTAVLTGPEHAVTVIATTRVLPTGLLKVEPARQHRLPLEEGLGSPDAQLVLRALDVDGHLVLRDAPGELLDALAQHTRGFPRALEAVKAILDSDDTLTPRDLLDHALQLPEDQVVQVLVGEAYDLLDAAAQQVMQALAVYPAPVSAVVAYFLLQPVNPTTNAAAILTLLVRRQLARFQDGHYYLHPIDRDYARSQLPPGDPGDPPAAFTLTGLQARAADYYADDPDAARILAHPGRRPAAARRVRAALPRLRLRHRGHRAARHRLRLSAGVGAVPRPGRPARAHPLAHHRPHPELCPPDQPGDRPLQPGRLPAGHLPAHPGPGHRPRPRRPPRRGRRSGQPGELPLQPGRLPAGHRPAHPGPGHRPLPRRPPRRGRRSGQPGNCHYSLGDYQRAIDLYTQLLAIARDTGDPNSEGAALGNLGTATTAWATTSRLSTCTPSAWPSPATPATATARAPRWATWAPAIHLGDYRRAIDLYTQAWPSTATPATATARAPRWATWGSAYSPWAATGRPSTCTPMPWPSPATSAAATARPTLLATWAGPGWRQATRARPRRCSVRR